MVDSDEWGLCAGERGGKWGGACSELKGALLKHRNGSWKARDTVLFRELPAALALERGADPKNRGRKLYLKPEIELRSQSSLCFDKRVTSTSDIELLFDKSQTTNSIIIRSPGKERYIRYHPLFFPLMISFRKLNFSWLSLALDTGRMLWYSLGSLLFILPEFEHLLY